MKSLLRMVALFVVVLVGVFGRMYGQEAPFWQLESTRVVDFGLLPNDRLSDTGLYLAYFLPNGAILNTLDLSREVGLEPFHYNWGVSYFPWLNDTIVYVPLSVGDQPVPCPPSAVTTLFRYGAATNSFDYICIETAPAEWSPVGIASQGVRSPHNVNLLLAHDRYLINLQDRSVTDIESVLSTQLDRNQMGTWVAHRNTLWDTQTWYPVARIIADITEGGPDTGVTGQTLKICAMASLDCDDIVIVEDYVHGRLSDYTVSSDGHTLLWSVIVYPIDLPIPRGGGIGSVQDVEAYATDIQSGATIPIFRLSDHTTTPFSTTTLWSPDGKTLAVGVIDLTSNEVIQPRFILLAQFTTADEAAHDEGQQND